MEQRGEKTRCCSQRQILSIATSKTAMVLGFIIVLGVYSSLQRKERIVTEITQVALDEPPVIHDGKIKMLNQRNPFSVGIGFRRQILTSEADPRTERITNLYG